MGVLEKLRRGILGWLGDFRDVFGKGLRLKFLEVRKEIIQQLRKEISSQNEKKVFPFKVVLIHLQPPTKRIAKGFKADFLNNASLKAEIESIFLDEEISLPEGMIIDVDVREMPLPDQKDKEPSPLFALELREPIYQSEQQVPELQLDILKGKAAEPVYRFVKKRLLVGCLPEVEDREGRLVRKNNVVFPHEEGEINRTVDRMHARIWFDKKRQEFRIMDESSQYGTRILRGGHGIEVPAENIHGVGLRTGDEVYFGQACIRFVLVRISD